MKKLLLIALVLLMTVLAFADVTIGAGTASQKAPFSTYYNYYKSAAIYKAGEIGASGTITSIQWYCGIANTTTTIPIKIYYKTTTNTTLAADTWVNHSAGATLIFDATITANATGWYNFDVTDFAYNGTDNLEILTESGSAAYVSPYVEWRYTTYPTYMFVWDDNDGSAPTSLAVSYNRPNIKFVGITNVNPPEAATLVSPNNGGYALIGQNLSWSASLTGNLPTAYDVYLDTTAGTTLVSNDQVGTTYTPTLAANTTYYWKVVPNNTYGEATGCPVWSFTTPGATQLAESFESTTFPPAGWANPGTWSRSTSYFKNGVASAYKYGSTSSQYILSTPKVTITGTSTLNLWTLCSSTSGAIQIVYSPDRTTWTQLGSNLTHTATYTWYNSNIDLSSLAGSNYYLGVRTSLTSASFYVDMMIGPDITPEAPGPVTLSTPAAAATLVNEYPTFTWTAPTTGGAPTGYKVYCDTNATPTTLIGTVTSGATLTYTATTALAFNTTYYWSVVAYNGTGDASMPTALSFTTRANPTISAFPTVWDFGTLSSDPFPPTNWTKHSGVLATPTVLGAAGTGNWIQDDWKNVTSPANKAGKINIYSTFNGWMISPPIAVPANDYEVKFDVAYMAYGNNNAPATGGTDDQFAVLVGDGTSWTPANVVRQWDNAGSTYVLNDIPPAGMTLSLPLGTAGTKYIAFYGVSTESNVDNDLMVDNIEVRQTPAAPIFSYAPSTIAFGEVIQNTPTAWTNVVVTNTGGGTLNLAAGDISIIGTDAAMFEFSAANLPAALGTGNSVNIPVRMTATSEGAKSATLRMVYDSTNYDVALSGTGLPAGVIPIGNGTSLLAIPIDPYFGYSYSQSLYLQSEINTADQRIEKIRYYWNGVGEATASNDWAIYMGHTTKTAFSTTTDWVPLSGMTQVFAGTVTLPATAGWIEITLSTPFVYNNTDNLVVAVEDNEADFDEDGLNFFSTATATNRSLRHNSDTVNADPAAPPTGTLVLAIPNVQLIFGDLPVGPPLPVVLGNPANEAADLAKAGFNFTWSVDPLSGPIEYYAFALSTDDQDMFGQFYSEGTATTINPVGMPYGAGTFAFEYNTRYYWQVIAYGGGNEAASDVRWFEIEVDPTTPITVFPYTVDFEANGDNTLPARWTRSSLATGWEVGSALGSSYWSVPAHTVYAATNDDAAGSDGDGSMDLLFSPYFDFTGAYEGIPLLSFDSFFNGAYGQLADVEISTDGVNWTSIKSIEAGTAWESITVSLADYDGMSGVQLRFHADDQGGWASGWAIDNISLAFVNIDLMTPIVDHYPVIGWPIVDADITISADVYDDLTWNSGLTSVTLNYAINGGTENHIPMALVGGLYEAAIPGQAAGSVVSYSITAVDASAQANTITTDVWDFDVNSPVWLQYDANTITNNIGLGSGTFGIMTGFGNPFGAGNPCQINSVFARSLYATTANVHVYTYNGETDTFTDVIPSFSQSFLAATDTVIPLSNCTTTAGIFYVALTDVPGGNYFAHDGSQDYYPGTHFVHFGAGMSTANLGTVESSGFPGSWLVRANVEAGVSAIDAPVVTITSELDGPTLAWAAVTGANSYHIYGSADPVAETFTLLDTIGSSPYIYTGTEGYMFFKVTADTTGLPAKRTISSRVNTLRNMVANHRLKQAPKASLRK